MELGWASILTDFTHFGKQSKSYAPAVWGLHLAVLWVSSICDTRLRRYKLCPSQRIRTCNCGFAKATQESPSSPLHYQCQQSASHPTSFLYHPFSISLWQIMKYVSAILSQVSVWGIKQSSLQWMEVLWHSSGSGWLHAMGRWHAPLLALLLISFLLSGCSFCVGREMSSPAMEIKLTVQAIWKAFCWAQGQSEEDLSVGKQQTWKTAEW